jgi:putative hydrolase of the HAD superfamily
MKVIVFDLYNTLVEIKHQSYIFRDLYKEVARLTTHSYQEYVEVIMSNPIEELFNSLPGEFKASYDAGQELLREEIDSITLIPGSIDLLNSLKEDHRLFLISNLATPYKRPFFELGLNDYFEQPVFSCDVGCVKPSAQIFEIIENLAGVPTSQITMVGDSLRSDAEGAKAVGWNYIRINRQGDDLKEFEVARIADVRKRISSPGRN